MLDDHSVLTIARPQPLPSPEMLAAFAEAPSGHVVDAMGGRGALAAEIKILAGPQRLVGPALTCHCGPDDNLAALAALVELRAGEVVVCACDGFRGAAVIGDLVMGMLKNAGGAGFVTDGLVRDIAGIEAVGLPLAAAGITPNSPSRTGPGSVGAPVNLGGARVESGDIVVADRDGVVVVPRVRIAATAARLPDIARAEAAAEAAVADGQTSLAAIDDLLASPAVKRV